MTGTKKRLLTGLQSSGDLHIGNYFGALKPFVDMYEEYDSFLMVADYHALTSVRDPEVLRQNSINVVKDYLAAGVDPEKCVIFRQSENQDHMELGWVFNCLVTVSFLELAHAYKDKVAKGQEASAGLFTYPMLQAADIALYNTDIVPVGEDQRQHIEYTREAVGKFNRAYGELLKEPQEKIFEGVGVVPGTDGAKMSKSYGNTIPLFGSKEEVEKAVMSIVTNSMTREEAIEKSRQTGEVVIREVIPVNLFNIHKLLRPIDELDTLYHSEEYLGRYGDLKKILVEDLEALIAPMREKRASISDDDVRAVLADGAKKAKEVSNETIAKVRDAIGISI